MLYICIGCLYVMEYVRKFVVAWLLMLLCGTFSVANGDNPSSPTRAAHYAIPVMGFFLFFLFIYLYNKRYFRKKVYATEEPELPASSSEMKRRYVMNDLVNSNFSPEKPSSFSAEFKPPKLVFFENVKPPPFTVENLLRASAELLGQGSFGNLYKVVMADGTALVVKRLKDLLVRGQEFEKRMVYMGGLKHPNILPSYAYCSSQEENLIIYHYERSGSLASLLRDFFSGQRELNWDTRLAIAGGVARGLAYLHQEFESQGVAHGNLKPSNVILGDSLEPFVADYGFNSLVDAGSSTSVPFSVNAYKAPERRITQKSDVYSFGIILLELLTGKKADSAGFDISRWVQSTIREEWTVEVFDKEVVSNVRENRIFPMLHMALRCVSRTPENRPKMNEVTDMIEKLWNQQDDSSSFESSSSFHSITELPGGGISMATPSPIRQMHV